MSRLLPYDPFLDDLRSNPTLNSFLHQNKSMHSNANYNYNYNASATKGLDESEDQKWNMAAAKLALSDQLRSRSEIGVGVRNNPVSDAKTLPSPNGGNNKQSSSSASGRSSRSASSSGGGKNKHKGSTQNEMVNSVINKVLNLDMKQHASSDASQKGILSHASSSPPSAQNTQNPSPTPAALDKRFKTLPPSESLPRNETLGGYIFVCNNDTMQEDLKRQLFGLPQRYRDSVRAIQPGLPLFLYNYTTHQLHGIFEATSFGGSNIDPTAWEDKKNKGESRFPAQVRIRVRKMCKPLEEDAFRPVLFHYDGPKFRLQLSVPETLAIMDLLTQNGSL